MKCEPLNPGLYRALVEHFGEVQIQCAGIPYMYSERREGIATHVTRTAAGEQYYVRCPICRDHKLRLAISHASGTSLPNGITLGVLAHCWNENCNVSQYLAAVFDNVECSLLVPARESRAVVSPDDMALLSHSDHLKLRGVVPLNDPLGVPGAQYITSRGFNIEHLVRAHGVGYCVSGRRSYNAQRVIIPMLYTSEKYQPFIEVAWQARAIPNISPMQDRKYYTSPGCKRGFFVSGQHIARQYPSGVVTEGPTKQWRVGLNAVSLWGKSMSEAQAKVIADMWAGSTAAIPCVADPGFERDWQIIVSRLQLYVPDRARVVLVVPPVDIGDMTYRDAWATIAAACKQAGREVPYPGEAVLSLI